MTSSQNGWVERIGHFRDNLPVSFVPRYANNKYANTHVTYFVYISIPSASNELLAKSRIVLVCEGLDTVADVYVNNILVGSSQNQFVRYIFNIKFAIQVGKI